MCGKRLARGWLRDDVGVIVLWISQGIIVFIYIAHFNYVVREANIGHSIVDIHPRFVESRSALDRFCLQGWMARIFLEQSQRLFEFGANFRRQSKIGFCEALSKFNPRHGVSSLRHRAHPKSGLHRSCSQTQNIPRYLHPAGIPPRLSASVPSRTRPARGQ